MLTPECLQHHCDLGLSHLNTRDKRHVMRDGPRATRATVSVQGPGNFLRMDCSRQPLRDWTRQGQGALKVLGMASWLTVINYKFVACLTLCCLKF